VMGGRLLAVGGGDFSLTLAALKWGALCSIPLQF
jgi:hypothetical protein